MTKFTYTRRQMLQLSATAGTAFTLPALASAQAPQSATARQSATYATYCLPLSFRYDTGLCW